MIKKKRNGKNGTTPVVLIVLDGWGVAKKSPGNAIALARTPNFRKLWNTYSHTTLQADGKAVGLPAERVGNSEAGHITLGAGRIVDQDAVLINKDINTGKFFKNSAFESAVRHVEKNKSRLHLMGMLSNGQSGHSDPDHLLALLTMTRLRKVKNVYLHLFTDGRDAPPHSALKMLAALMRQLVNRERGTRLEGEWIATLMGRFHAMDRKKEWSRTASAYDAIIMSQGRKAKSPQAAITEAYNRQETDEFIQPYVIERHGRPVAKVKDGDAVIFFNLRSDRARQLTKAFVQKNFNALNPGSFKRKHVVKNLAFVAMTDFGPDLPGVLTAYPSPDLRATLPMLLRHYRQLYIAEREKYAHVTFFFNGGYADPVAGEDRIVIPSPEVENYAQRPGMATAAIAANILEGIHTHDFICANFANADMIAHTGDLAATVKGVEEIDDAIDKISVALLTRHGTLIITADHGNAEQMLDPNTGAIDTEHNHSPVPFLLVESRRGKRQLRRGTLADVAPTILKIFKLPKPKEMTGRPLY